MNLGLRLSIDRIIRGISVGGQPSWRPTSLFSNGEQGVWYDPSDFERYMAGRGPELVTNGTFDTDTAGWLAAGDASIAAVGGQLVLTRGTAQNYAYFTASTVIGKTYAVVYYAESGTVSPYVQVGNSPNNGALMAADGNTGTRRAVFTATASNSYITVGTNGGTAGMTVRYDNVSLRELTQISTATLYQDSAGTTPVTAMEQPVGLMLDKRLGLVRGAEQSTAPGPYTATTGWSAYQATHATAAGELVITSTLAGLSNAEQSISVVSGRSYEVSWTVRRGTNPASIDLAVFDGAAQVIYGNVAATAATTVRAIVLAKGSALAVKVNANTNAAGQTSMVSALSVRELPGNHAAQSTAAARPVLSSRKNLTLNSGGLGASGAAIPTLWSAEQSLGGIAPSEGQSGAWPNGKGYFQFRINGTSAASTRLLLGTNQNSPGARVPVVAGVPVTIGYDIQAVAGTNYGIQLTPLWYDAANAFISNSFGIARGGISTSQSHYAETFTPPVGATQMHVRFDFINAPAFPHVFDFTVRLGGIQVELGSAETRYQRVTTATDYDSVGFPHYLKFDGVDDFLVTGSINFTATDKMTVWAGVRKLSDAAVGMIAELSANAGGNLGTFRLTGGNPANTYEAVSNGTFASAAITGTMYVPPVTNVLSLSAAISTDLLALRVNGASAANAATDQGAGNYGNYPLYIGRRAGTTLPFNGHLYGLTIRGAVSTTTQITSGEKYTNGKTHAWPPGTVYVPPPITVPNAPIIGTASASQANQASVTFTPPSNDGGSPITSYTATSSPGGFTASGAGSPLTVTGLTNGTAYTFTVKATNAVGQSAASAASNSVTPVVPNMLVNPSFVGGTGWTFDVGGNFTGDKANFTGNADQKLTHTGALTLTNGVSYVVSGVISGYVGGSITPQFTVSGGAPAATGTAITANGAFSQTIVANGNNSFRLLGNSGGPTMTVDDVSIVPL